MDNLTEPVFFYSSQLRTSVQIVRDEARGNTLPHGP